MANIFEVCQELKTIIENAYNEGVTIQDAERLAAKTLVVRIDLSQELKVVDLDSRMKKHGVKVTRADAYMEEIKKHDKKPVESFLEAAVTMNGNVIEAEHDYAKADVHREMIHNYLDIFKDAHIYFRGIAKGTYEA
jgi:hypothetical protein